MHRILQRINQVNGVLGFGLSDRYYQGKGGMHSLSWKLSTNLWGMIIEGARYRRESMGYKRGGV
jgi:hypothetical protein